MTGVRYVVVDVFTDRPLAGNQLAVFTDARELDADTMQALAREIGFSETTFVLPPEAVGHARVRIFNPRHEMPFAGHPVLGTAFMLGTPLQLGAIALETGAGVIDVALERDESGRLVFGRMEQPVPAVRSVPDTDALFAVLGITRSELPVALYDNGATHIVVTLESMDAVAALATPDAKAIEAFGVTGVNCVAGAGKRWKSRMFWPDGEDAATGSAAGPIAVHACTHGLAEWGEWIEISQGAEMGRPSTLHALAEAAGGEVTRVAVGGSAVVVARGEFRL